MHTALLLVLALQSAGDRAQLFFDDTRFAEAAPETDAERRALEVITAREHWMGAYRAIEERFGPFPDGLRVNVDFDYEGEELARGAGGGTEGRVRFNLRRIGKYQEKIDEIERQREELAKQGKRIFYKVPPVRFERIVYHELTHVFQRGVDAPDWFNEGMAQLVSGDMNALCAFVEQGRVVDSIERGLAETNDIYARGHIFWKWLDSRGAAREVARAAVLDRRPWKEALESALHIPWPMIVRTEREWSEREAEKLKPAPPAK